MERAMAMFGEFPSSAFCSEVGDDGAGVFGGGSEAQIAAMRDNFSERWTSRTMSSVMVVRYSAKMEIACMKPSSVFARCQRNSLVIIHSPGQRESLDRPYSRS